MRWTSILAIYTLFWAMSFFFVPGQAPSAPPRFSFARTAKWTTLVAAVLFGLYYANYVYQWVPVDTFNFVPDRVIEGN
jgi:predicted secreted protein